MDWDTFKIVALISAIIAILDKTYTYGKPIYTEYIKKSFFN